MDVLVNILNKYNFCRSRSNLGRPIVVHSVPGAGKSTLIRELIRADRRFGAITYGECDCQDLSGQIIHKASDKPDCEFLLVDEYLNGEWLPEAFAVFADPLQGGETSVKPADFTCKVTRRFGSSTAAFLRDLGFEIEASGQDSVQVADLYSVDPKGVIIHHQPEVRDLLAAHGVQSLCVAEVRGKTFDHVTFVTSESLLISRDRATVYQALTRHRRSLLILAPDASYTTA